MNDIKVIKILNSIIKMEKKRNSTIINITKQIYNNRNTHSKYYTDIIRYINSMQRVGLIKKIKPKQREGFKTHYVLVTHSINRTLIQKIIKSAKEKNKETKILLNKFEKEYNKKQIDW